MLVELLAVMAPVLIVAGIGYGWARSGQPYPTDFVTRLVLNVSTPCLVLSTLSRAEVDLGVFSQVALACVIITEGAQPEEGALRRAEERHIPLLLTEESTYTVVARLAALGVPGAR